MVLPLLSFSSFFIHRNPNREFIEFKPDGTPNAVDLQEMFFFDPAAPGGR